MLLRLKRETGCQRIKEKEKSTTHQLEGKGNAFRIEQDIIPARRKQAQKTQTKICMLSYKVIKTTPTIYI